MIHTNYNELSAAEAIAIQQEFREHIQLTPLQQEIKTIGGADISFNKHSETVYAGIIVLSYPDMQVIHHASTTSIVKFPYVPGLLAFREVPALAEVWNKLEIKPDVLVLDGHGIAHPRRMGIATHFGIVAGVPTIGCAKSLLTGKHALLPNVKFSTIDLTDKNETIGELLRTKLKCNPVYVSPGHLITLKESVEIIKTSTGKYRIPEPTRMAHLLVNEVRKAAGEETSSDTIFC